MGTANPRPIREADLVVKAADPHHQVIKVADVGPGLTGFYILRPTGKTQAVQNEPLGLYRHATGEEIGAAQAQGLLPA